MSDAAEIRGEGFGQHVWAESYGSRPATRRIVRISCGYDAYSVEFTHESLYQSLEAATQAAKDWLEG